jgi:hypothetical protein
MSMLVKKVSSLEGIKQSLLTETTIKPSKTTIKPSKTTIKPSKTTIKPSKTTIKPSKTTIKPSKTTIKPSEKILIMKNESHDKPHVSLSISKLFLSLVFLFFLKKITSFLLNKLLSHTGKRLEDRRKKEALKSFLFLIIAILYLYIIKSFSFFYFSFSFFYFSFSFFYFFIFLYININIKTFIPWFYNICNNIKDPSRLIHIISSFQIQIYSDAFKVGLILFIMYLLTSSAYFKKAFNLENNTIDPFKFSFNSSLTIIKNSWHFILSTFIVSIIFYFIDRLLEKSQKKINTYGAGLGEEVEKVENIEVFKKLYRVILLVIFLGINSYFKFISITHSLYIIIFIFVFSIFLESLRAKYMEEEGQRPPLLFSLIEVATSIFRLLISIFFLHNIITSSKYILKEVNKESLDEEINRESLDEEINRESLDEEINRESLDEEINRESLDKEVNKESLDEEINRESLDT